MFAFRWLAQKKRYEKLLSRQSAEKYPVLYYSFISFSFDPDPTKRINFWGVVFGNALTGASVYGHRQEGYQRYAAMPTINKANL